jgi:hypothetical protein
MTIFIFYIFLPVTIMGINTQKRQFTIIAVVALLSIIMITGMTASSLFDQKADAVKFKPKKFIKGGNGGDGGNGGNTGGNIASGGNGSNGGSGGNGGTGGNGGSGNTGVSGGGTGD